MWKLFGAASEYFISEAAFQTIFSGVTSPMLQNPIISIFGVFLSCILHENISFRDQNIGILYEHVH